MSDPDRKVKLSPMAEGGVGAIAGTLVGMGLYYGGIISAPAIAGVTLGLGLGSWFNAWRRQKRSNSE